MVDLQSTALPLGYRPKGFGGLRGKFISVKPRVDSFDRAFETHRSRGGLLRGCSVFLFEKTSPRNKTRKSVCFYRGSRFGLYGASHGSFIHHTQARRRGSHKAEFQRTIPHMRQNKKRGKHAQFAGHLQIPPPEKGFFGRPICPRRALALYLNEDHRSHLYNLSRIR